MNGLVTTNRYARTVDLPISFAQTELRAGKSITIAKITLAMHQRLELRSLSIALTTILTPEVLPVFLNTVMNLCSVGLYRGLMLTGPLAAASFSEQPTTTNIFSPCAIETPGTYNVIVSNNTSNIDMAVVATGAMKLYY